MPETLPLDRIREALNHADKEAVIAATGLSRWTIYNIANGKHANPTLRTMRALSDWLRAPVCDVRNVQGRKVCVRCGVAWQADDPNEHCRGEERTT